jgi:pimeloyl-ACP methyl ester carboxylesterase
MPTAAVNGTEIYYEERGSGFPLIMIPGLGGNHTAYLPVMDRFQAKFRCIAMDARGSGLSPYTGPLAIETIADDVAAVCASLGIERADFMGVSLGSTVLQALAYRHPALARRIALVSALPNYTEIQHAWLDSGILLRKAEVDPLVQFAAVAPWVYTPRFLSNHADLLKIAQLGAQAPYPASLEGYLAQAAAIRAFDSRSWLHAITAETLVLVGAEDVLTPIHQAAEIASLIPGAKLQVLPRGGHGMLAEYADDVIRALRRFFEAAPRDA